METNTRRIEELGTSVKVMQTAIEEMLPLLAIQQSGPQQEMPLLRAEIVVQPVQHEMTKHLIGSKIVRDLWILGRLFGYNSKLCSCGGIQQIFYWDVSTGRVIRKFRGHDGKVTSVSYHPKDSCMITASVDGTIRVWKT